MTTKLRWLAVHEPDAAARTAHVMLPHGCPGGWATQPSARHRPRRRLGHRLLLPRDRPLAAGAGRGRAGQAGRAAAGRRPGRGRGPHSRRRGAVGRNRDNMGAALGLGLGVGEVVVSIGTSGTAYAVATQPAADETGAVAGFADATGRFLPLVATINAARVLTVTARMLGTDAACVLRLAPTLAPPGAQGLTLLPYLDGERSPNRPGANGVLRGLTSANTTPENLARAAVEAVLCSRTPSTTWPTAASPRGG